jgi:hypothetical protein
MDAKNVYYLYRNLVEETMQGHKNAKEASKKLKEYKRKIGKILTDIK